MTTAAPLRPLTLCADDFGLHDGISDAIIALARQERIHAASAMVNGVDWERGHAALQASGVKLDLGLHLTLTEMPPLSVMPRLAPHDRLPELGRLARLALLRRLNAHEIMGECRRQMDRFIAVAGHKPTHLDGHQHVHGFPVIRDAVLSLASHYRIPVRQCSLPLAAMRRRTSLAKALALNLLHGGFSARLRREAEAQNLHYRGLHDFNPAADIAVLYDAWLRHAPPGTLINCHPSLGIMPDDPIAAWRQHEYDFLAGAKFAILLQNVENVARKP